MERGSFIVNICAGYNLAKYSLITVKMHIFLQISKLQRNIKDRDEERMVVQPLCLIKNGFVLYHYDFYILNSAYFYVSLYNSCSIISDFNTKCASFYFYKNVIKYHCMKDTELAYIMVNSLIKLYCAITKILEIGRAHV